MTGSGLPPAKVASSHGLRTPIAIVGAGGMLGRAMRELLAVRGISFRAFSHAELDICLPQSVAALADCPTVINCAAWTDVDGAQANEPGAFRLNADAVGVLGDHCRSTGATLVHFGTDYVFSGVATSPFPLDAAIAPLNAYGRSKAAGEVVLRDQIDQGLKVLYARTSWLYAPWGKNFVRTIAAASATRPQLQVVDDQRGRPTSSLHLARCTVALLERGVEGVTHLTDGGECTWFGLAKEIVRVLGRPCEVLPCSSAQYPRPATRPSYSVLDLSNAEGILNDQLASWQQNLVETLSLME
jgi:dTDP-4-dehydrorhamnose reductase